MHRRYSAKCLLLAGLLVCVFSVSAAADIITVMAANLTTGNFQSYEEQGIRLFQGLKPDIVLIQEFNYRNGSLRDLVDVALGPDYDFMVEPGSHAIPTGIISRFPILDSGSWSDAEVPDRNFSWAVIDIPGDIPLQCVSVHFKGGSASNDAARRTAQAQAVMSYMSTYFDSDAYIVLGGDLNTWSVSENALSELAGGLEVDSHIPVDQLGNRNTNEPRNRPYDWVIPNARLNAAHVALIIESSVFEHGMVFDSHIHTPLDEVPPIQYGDSHANSMQHMPVMKAFSIPVSTATPTPTAGPGEPTHTPLPTYTPAPTRTPIPTPTPDPTPDPTATPVCTGWGSRLSMPSTSYTAGDICYCHVTVCNPTDQTETDMVLFVILDVYGTLFFGPEFNEYGFYRVLLTPGETLMEILPEFIWPVNAGDAQGIIWYAALTDAAVTGIIGEFDMFEFGWR